MRCPTCVRGHLVRRENPCDNGAFNGYSHWPYCEHSQPPCPACGRGLPVKVQGGFRCRACGQSIEACPACGGWLRTRTSKYGRLLGCSNWPACKYTRDGAQRQWRRETSSGGGRQAGGRWSVAIDPEDSWLPLFLAPPAPFASNMAATLEMLTEVGTLVLFFALFPLIVSCIRSAERMPPDQGGIAGWLRWYVGTAVLGLPVAIPSFAGNFVREAYGMVGWIVGTLVAIAVISPLVIAPLIKRAAARTVTICGLYGHAVLELLPITNETDWVRSGLCLAWGTYFLRSKRVKATYRPNPAQPH